MRAQRSPDAAPCVPGVAGSLPFPDKSFDTAMAVLTDQHWPDVIAGYREMQRVAPPRRDLPLRHQPLRSWLPAIRDYLPEHIGLTAGRPQLSERADAIGG